MKQSDFFNKELCAERLENLMMRVFRFFSTFCVILIASQVLAAEPAPFSLARFIKAKNYSLVVDHLKTIKRPLSKKERMYQALAYGKMNKLDQKIESLRASSKQYSDTDLFLRELAAAVELKADSYADTLNYTSIKAALYAEASQILSDLYSKKPSSENFAALIQYHNRQQQYEETVGLLEIYGRKKDKGKIFYTYMCEAQFKATLYSAALKISKTIAQLGERELAQKQMVQLAGRFPASAPVQFEAGRVLIEQGDSAKGLEFLEKHLEVSATDAALVLKAETQFKNGDEKEALTTFVQACKQHKEPRRLLLEKMKSAHRKLASDKSIKKTYEMELSRCRYSYRLKKQAPKGLLGGSFKKSQK